jgi:hypothetical protein
MDHMPVTYQRPGSTAGLRRIRLRRARLVVVAGILLFAGIAIAALLPGWSVLLTSGLPPRLELPAPHEPLRGQLTLCLEGTVRGRLLVQGRYVAALRPGHVTVQVQEGDLIEVDARSSASLTLMAAQVTEPLVLMPCTLPVQAGGRLVHLGWVRGPDWPGVPDGR